MSTRAAGRLAWSAWGACVALTIAECVLVALNFGTPGLNNVGALDTFLNILFSIAFLAFPTVGALVASRYPRNAIGWIFLAVGLTLTVSFVANEYGIRALIGDPGSLPGGEVIAWLSTWLILPGLILATTFLLLLFPNGTLPSRRWRPVAWLIVSSVAALTVAIATTPGPLSEAPFTSVENPFGLEGRRGMLHELTSILFPFVLTSCVAAAAALLLRFRRARGEERAQLKWIAFAGALLVPSFIATGVLHEPAVTVAQVVTLVLVTCLPVAAGIAILKYRLYDIDRVISKTLVYGSLTVVLGGSVRRPRACWSDAVLVVRGRLEPRDRGRRRSSSRRSSSRCARACSASSTDASTGAATTRSGRSRHSAHGCASRSTSARSSTTSGASSPRRCSRRTRRSGCGGRGREP